MYVLFNKTYCWYARFTSTANFRGKFRSCRAQSAAAVRFSVLPFTVAAARRRRRRHQRVVENQRWPVMAAEFATCVSSGIDGRGRGRSSLFIATLSRPRTFREFNEQRSYRVSFARVSRACIDLPGKRDVRFTHNENRCPRGRQRFSRTNPRPG